MTQTPDERDRNVRARLAAKEAWEVILVATEAGLLSVGNDNTLAEFIAQRYGVSPQDVSSTWSFFRDPR